jgi:hypothetical protein
VILLTFWPEAAYKLVKLKLVELSKSCSTRFPEVTVKVTVFKVTVFPRSRSRSRVSLAFQCHAILRLSNVTIKLLISESISKVNISF